MAKLKITQIEGKVNTGTPVQLSALNIPINLANYNATAIGSIGKSLKDIFKSQKNQNDNIEFADLEKQINLDVLKSFENNKKLSNLETALNNFSNDLSYSNYKDLGSNKSVKLKIKKHLATLNSKYSLDLGKEVMSNHSTMAKDNLTQRLDYLTRALGSKDTVGIPFYQKHFDAFFNDVDNINLFGEKKLQEMKEKAIVNIEKLRIINKGELGEINLFDDKQRAQLSTFLEARVSKEEAKTIINKIRNINMSLTFNEEKAIEFRERQNKDKQITTFSGILIAISDYRKNPNSEAFDKLPDLDDIYDMRISGAINSSQYEQLLRVYANPNTQLPNYFLEEVIGNQLYLAETVAEFDAIKDSANLDERYLGSLSIDHQITLNNIIDKYKGDRAFAKEHKKYLRYLKTNTNKISEQTQNFMSSWMNGVTKGSNDQQNLANTIIDEYNYLTLEKNFQPEQAYEEVIKGLDKDKLPELAHLPMPRSVNIKNMKEFFNENTNGFDHMRNQVALAFSKNKNIETYKEDMKRIDLLEDVFNIRLDTFSAIKNSLDKKSPFEKALGWNNISK